MSRLLVYDRTCVGAGARAGLSDAWRAGSVLYRGLSRIDAAHGVASWADAFDWLAGHEEITEIQYWGHGRRGRALVDRESFDLESMRGVYDARMSELRERLAPDASIWFRTCETLGGEAGHAFAQGLGERLGVAVAGHTRVIGFWQSGLHRLAPGRAPHWPTDEGVSPKGPAAVALGSSPLAPHTISCLQNTYPLDW